jgi:dethiobiotin synthetase
MGFYFVKKFKSMKLFITGIGTDVGKTIAAAIITESLEADYGNLFKLVI